MKKYGYHRLELPSGEIVEGPLVVVLDASSRLTEWHELVGEEAMVEWVGGVFSCISREKCLYLHRKEDVCSMNGELY